MDAKALKRRAAGVCVDFGVWGYSVRVGSPMAGAWAHCDYERREIVFSRMLLQCDWVFVNQIILHEVAHAVAGQAAKHGKGWMKTARAMGYRLGVRVPYVAVPAGHKWVARCMTGQHSSIRYERGAADGVLGCRPCMESGGGDVGIVWEELEGA